MFKYNKKSSKFGAPESRYSLESVENLIQDIYILAKCDYFVGTFSSHISRIVFELMNSFRIDAYSRAKTLDSIYFFAGGNRAYKIAIYDHFTNYKNSTDRFNTKIELKKMI